MPSLDVLLLLQIAVVVMGAIPTHQPHITLKPTSGGGEVDAAIMNLDVHYNDALCLALLLVDCATHVTNGDEQVCGSNGITYDNHCRFTHAVCETLNFKDHKITLKSHGACPHIAVSITTSVSNTTPATVSNTTLSTVSHTTDSSGDMMFNLFCTNVASITCPSELKVICGSDSQFYPNMCVFTKERCKNTSLTISQDPNRC
ncbi:uncharacterized protein LOC127837389 [Dreissena polymorpha]|uniref:Kazal-like domain-containing protein n=1 Tax=Dreissena polymorpha TaxID=45954 RepID=A0A9D4IYI5_DREPO|nr:uncharacterized protein LOC127837389 [Dreissena polymorpha]KAH3791645.1 hypothetical protein DPMN_145134 [Dreissena polymorpha]